MNKMSMKRRIYVPRYRLKYGIVHVHTITVLIFIYQQLLGGWVVMTSK